MIGTRRSIVFSAADSRDETNRNDEELLLTKKIKLHFQSSKTTVSIDHSSHSTLLHHTSIMATRKNKRHNREKNKKKKQARNWPPCKIIDVEPRLNLKVYDAAGRVIYYHTSIREGHYVESLTMTDYHGASPLQMWCVDLPPIKNGMPVAGGVRVVIGRNVVYTSPVPWNGDHILCSDPVRIGLTYRPKNTEGRAEILALMFPIEAIRDVLTILGKEAFNPTRMHLNRTKKFATGDDDTSIIFNFDTLKAQQVDNREQDHH